MADPIDTGKKTPEGRIIWNDGVEDYSERSTTFEIDGKWYTMPTVSEDGLQYTSDQIRDYVAEYGPIDFLTGEKLPEFRNKDDALEYAGSRSDTRKGYNEGGLTEQTDTLFDSRLNFARSYGVEPVTDINTNLTFKDAATFVAEATPIIGDAIAAKEVYDELKKENPNYLLVGALGGAAVIGLIPGLGDAAAAGIRKGARSALDASKRMIPTKKVDDVYNPVISDGPGSYDPIVEKYLTPTKPTEKVGTSIPKINMIEGSAAGINNKTVTQSAVDLMNEPAFGEGFAEKLQQVAAENSIAVGDKTFMPMDVYTELFDRVNNPEFKIIEPIEKQKSFSTIEDLMVQKDSGLFDNETDLLLAFDKGVLNTAEYFRAKADLVENKLNSLDSSNPKFKEYEKFSDVYNNIDLETLLNFAREYPVAPDTATGMQYEKFAADAKKYDSGLVEFADDIGVDPNDFIDVIKDAIPFTGDSVFPNYLPRATDSGDIYPRKATDYTQSNTESLLAKIPTKTDRAASKLGFDDTVYHLAVSEDEFTKFKNVDDLIPEIKDGPTNKFEGVAHDLLGVHVGTARAAAERFRSKSLDFVERPRYTMQLRAKLDKPVRVEDISEIIGFNPLKLQLDDSGLNFTEKDLKTIIRQKAIQKNTAGKEITTSMENQAAIELRKELADAGFTHIPYVNELEDKDSISYIMLVDRKKGDPAVLRDYNAKFDPEEAASTDLRMSQGGVTMKDQMQMAFMQEGGLKDDGMDVDPVSGNEIPPGSMASEVRDDIPAQLSEGEYVVPADVVQYYGVKFFEDLRMDAKRGLADMESNGRIGGEPIDMPMDDTPTVAVSTGGYIDGIPAAEYNVGGMASNLYNNPTQMDQEVNNIISTMYNNPQVMDELSRRGIQLNRTQAPMNPQQMNQANPPAEARMGFNPGGLTNNQAANYNYITSPTIPGQMYQTPGASYIYASPPQLTTTSAGAGSNMPSVEYCNSIDMDYDPSTKMCVPRASAQTPQQGGGGNDDPGPDMPKPQPWFENVNWEDPKAQMDSFFGKEGRIGSAVAGVAGSMIGGPLLGGAATFGAQVSNLAQSRAMATVYRAMGMEAQAKIIEEQAGMDGTIVKGNKALGMADQTINKMFGSDGDMYAISALKDVGIDVPRGLRDEDLQKYVLGLSKREQRLLRDKYAPNYKDPVVTPTKDDEEPDKKPTYVTTDSGTGETINPFRPTGGDDKPSVGVGKSGIDIRKEQEGSVNVGGPGFRSSSSKKSTTPKKVNIKKEQEKSVNVGGPGFRNKGGLMSKKKKKK